MKSLFMARKLSVFARFLLLKFLGFYMIYLKIVRKKMKYFSESNAPTSKARKYTNFSPEYQWNEKESVLEKVGERDDQEYIQSFESVALDKVFDKFLPEEAAEALGLTRVEFTDEVVDGTVRDDDDLTVLGDILDGVEEFRERYKLPDSYTTAQVLRYVQEKCAKEVKDVQSGVGVFGVKSGDGVGSPNVDSNVDKDDEKEII